MDDLIIEVDDDLLAELSRLALTEGCSVEELARRLIVEEISKRRG